MPTHTLAAIQMSSAFGEVQANLAKAEVLVHNAAAAGAELVVLPELFNTGYAYTPLNYELAETPDGLTAGWIKQLAKNLDIHLAGSFLQRRDAEIYNTLQLTAPDGRTWTYDKNHPWGWKWAYFCPGRGPKIAETRLGRIGLLICYDVTHPNSFSAYVGKIQLLLISSSPPKVNRMRLHFPGEEPIEMEETGAVARLIQESGDEVFDGDLRAQTAWLGVPLINAMPYGEFSSVVPKPKRSFAASLSGNPLL